MQHNQESLKKRLECIWQAPDFESLFAITGRPPHSIRKKTIIFNDGDPLDRLYFIKDGFVKLYQLSEDGKETVSYLYGPGDVLGLRALTSNNKCSKHNAETMTDIKVMTLSRQEFFDYCLDKPEYLVDLVQLCLSRLIYTETRLEAFITKGTSTRVAIFLNYCAKRFGNPADNEIILPISFTHQLIAEFIGSLRETVTLALGRLVEERVLKIEKGKITILDPGKLEELAHYQMMGT